MVTLIIFKLKLESFDSKCFFDGRSHISQIDPPMVQDFNYDIFITNKQKKVILYHESLKIIECM
ncbi:hypothetical protein BLOT_013292 [Blomia tropicalis]|nr:hypothetical protein BLOT_013292 [Blomia tropicalis]